MKESYFIFDKMLRWGGGRMRRFKNGRIFPSACPLNRHNQASDSSFEEKNRDELLFTPFFCLVFLLSPVVCRVLSFKRQAFRRFRLRKTVSFKSFRPINRRFLFFTKYLNFYDLDASSLFSRDFDSFFKGRSRRPPIYPSLMMANDESCYHYASCVKLCAIT